MSVKMYTIAEFKGIDQSKSENGLNPSYSPDACNMDTDNGDLTVAKGYVRHIPSTFQILEQKREAVAMYVWRRKDSIRILVGLYRVYDTYSRVFFVYHSSSDNAWHDLGGINLPVDVRPKCSFLEVELDGKAQLLIATGGASIGKWDGEIGHGITDFGSTDKKQIALVATYSNKVITLDREISQHYANRLMLAGANVNNFNNPYPVESVDIAAKTITLKTAPSTAPAAGNYVGIFGGLSKENTHLLVMHYGRLFAAGNLYGINPVRLYWSKVPGDYRSIEDWSADDASSDTGGGHVDVGSSNDPIIGLCALSNQLLIFKRDSLYRLLGDRPSNFRIYKINAEVEETTGEAIILYGDTPMWMTNAGLYYFDGQTARPMGNARQIKAFLAEADLTACRGKEARDKLYFTSREGNSDIDNAVIVYDVINKTYMIRRGFEVADICASAGTLLMINRGDHVYRMEEGDTYDGNPIHAHWKTPLSDLNGKYEEKTLVKMHLRGTTQKDAPLLVDSRAGRHTMTSRILLPENEYEVKEIPLQNQGRTAAFEFSNEAGGHWTLKGGIQVEFSVTGR